MLFILSFGDEVLLCCPGCSQTPGLSSPSSVSQNTAITPQKCHTLQSMNNHLEAVLKEKRSLRQRLLKPMCQENLPIEAVYHRYMVHLLELAVTFIERLETHLETIRNIPHLAANLKKMNQALAKMDILVTETEELAENILKWRKQQNEVSSCIPKILAEESYLYKHDIIMPPLPFTSKIHVQTINAK
ncbi:PREDICTED: HAUS augmin-like complex subunit 2 isoform X1 [Rhinopithecus bieti]|uniref:HAUS augmin-like complex subunit 2 isoform X1 n=1 Tax=Rhinopithecus bieti TaxID=61621 RepID=UPI00083C313B|nr:PREDICTED: HAUS augmin-like complex subunit 2 isoform X1 [Rhinopithecus bieti]XP_017715735.1 PREDICTED: HAUS augmin-like complex subunit 2 isoform X1 [Rhinopithecus bieti]